MASFLVSSAVYSVASPNSYLVCLSCISSIMHSLAISSANLDKTSSAVLSAVCSRACLKLRWFYSWTLTSFIWACADCDIKSVSYRSTKSLRHCSLAIVNSCLCCWCCCSSAILLASSFCFWSCLNSICRRFSRSAYSAAFFSARILYLSASIFWILNFSISAAAMASSASFFCWATISSRRLISFARSSSAFAHFAASSASLYSLSSWAALMAANSASAYYFF